MLTAECGERAGYSMKSREKRDCTEGGSRQERPESGRWEDTECTESTETGEREVDTAECVETERDIPSCEYLIAGSRFGWENRQRLLYEVLGPVFFGSKQAESQEELQQLFRRRYGIDVRHDFYEGDEHYEEYLEARQAIAEGLCIYGGEIVFEDCALAELADRVWAEMEKTGKGFRRINTALDE